MIAGLPDFPFCRYYCLDSRLWCRHCAYIIADRVNERRTTRPQPDVQDRTQICHCGPVEESHCFKQKNKSLSMRAFLLHSVSTLPSRTASHVPLCVMLSGQPSPITYTVREWIHDLSYLERRRSTFHHSAQSIVQPTSDSLLLIATS